MATSAAPTPAPTPIVSDETGMKLLRVMSIAKWEELAEEMANVMAQSDYGSVKPILERGDWGRFEAQVSKRFRPQPKRVGHT